ncbi:MAG TPA: DegT/DnrJ/EryC1/StrS aminotransferase family protein [Planctomycetaceae bacterium]|nr:DegT/DnrJ/EryC1/StrS aminotransferase family protein [Planctomycetaceae bacterium]
MWVRKRIDIGGLDIATGLVRCALPADQGRVTERVARLWAHGDDVLVCLSVRTGFDLLLQAVRFPRGSHLLMSAINIGDMVRIVEHHGLVPVPVDVEPSTMAPRVGAMARAITPAARGLVVAHLFGGRVAMRPIAELARRHGLMVIEDCAQAFDGGFRGHPEADVSMFSFGPIKTSTALGGAVIRVGDRQLLGRMRSLHQGYPSQTRVMYLRRLLKYVGIKGLSTRLTLRAVAQLFTLLKVDYDRVAGSAARGFAGRDFFDRIRRQPSPVLLAVLERRLRRFDTFQLCLQQRKAARLLELLGDHVACPGVASQPHTFWVFPILVDNPAELAGRLREAGFDATRQHSLTVIPAPAEGPAWEAKTASAIMERIVYLPLYPQMPDVEIERMAQIVTRAARRADRRCFESLAAGDVPRG